MLNIKSIKEVLGLEVLTDSGEIVGNVEEVNITDNKVDSWKIKVSRDSSLLSYLGGAKGLIIPQQYVKAIGKVMIISKVAVPERKEEEAEGVSVSE